MKLSDFALFVFGVFCGVGMMWAASWHGRLSEWRARNGIERKLKSIEWVLVRQKIMCGAGFPCSGGPNCTADHK